MNLSVQSIVCKAGVFLLILGTISCQQTDGNDNNSKRSYITHTSFDVENTGTDCDIPALTDYSNLDSMPELPNPFISMDGTRIANANGWRCRRDEISTQVQNFELGDKPLTDPENVRGRMNGDTLTVTVDAKDSQLSFDAVIKFPRHGKPPYPAMIGVGGSFLNNADLDSLGVAIIRFPSDVLAEQKNSSSRGEGKFYDMFGSDQSAGALMAWSWGVSRLIDALDATGGTKINNHRLGITGCSRWGKGALIAGAFDERIALTIPQESGAGGAASWRISEAQFNKGVHVQTLHEIVNENVWFADDFKKFSQTVEKLPFDHHEIMGMVAPRALLVIENSGIDWLGVKSTYIASVAARKIWKAIGIPDRMGVSQIGGHRHCQFPDSQRPDVNAFVKKFLLDDAAPNTNIVKTDAEIDTNLVRWAPWKTPTLN